MKIISGIFKGRNIKTLEGIEVRPTAAMVREAIFGKLHFGINGSSFLDLFGGSGAMGIEALSRGAEGVAINDKSIKAVNIIKQNLSVVGGEVKVTNYDYELAIKHYANSEFDYIFVDPPYMMDCIDNILNLLVEHNTIAEDGLVIYEHLKEKVLNNVSSHYIIIDNKNYSATTVSYIKRVSK